VEDLTSFRTNLVLSDLQEVGIRLNRVFSIQLSNGKRFRVHLGAYPFCGIPDDAIVMGEDPEDWLCLFSMEEFRNRPAHAVLQLGLSLGDFILIEIPVEEPRAKPKRLAMPKPIGL
jgi:hypothetical protein